MTVDGRQVPAEADRARMAVERHARLQRQLAEQGVDGLLLLGTSAVAYATGAAAPGCDSGRAALHRQAALVVAGADHPHLFTPWPEGAPPGLPADHLHPAAVPDLDDGAAALAAAVRDLVPGGATLGCDEDGVACNYDTDGCAAAAISSLFCFDGAWEQGEGYVCAL